MLAVLYRLLQLFALHEIELKLGEFTLDGYFSAAQTGHAHTRACLSYEMMYPFANPLQIEQLLAEIRPDAVALVCCAR